MDQDEEELYNEGLFYIFQKKKNREITSTLVPHFTK